MKFVRKGWNRYVFFIFLTVGLIFLASYGISYYYEFVYSTVTFVIGLIVLLIGIYGSMQGRSFGNRMVVPGYNSIHSTIELEREMQEIKRQGPYMYTLENRVMRFRSVPFALIISGLISFGITYFIGSA
ncbi:hypothetical protein [Paenibacillus terrigena]|uniref:hypothetical protein n=1 Tax=Paenibacillus terrigena TaxID=369333 RepID=UPI00037D8145|nr:hypothetical protein [Paenibacillus terrigena]